MKQFKFNYRVQKLNTDIEKAGTLVEYECKYKIHKNIKTTNRDI